MESYLYCGNSKLIAKHGMGVRVILEEANHGSAADVDAVLEIGDWRLEA